MGATHRLSNPPQGLHEASKSKREFLEGWRWLLAVCREGTIKYRFALVVFALKMLLFSSSPRSLSTTTAMKAIKYLNAEEENKAKQDKKNGN